MAIKQIPQRDRADQYTEQEAQRRTETALRAAFNTPAKPQSEMKLGKAKAKLGESPKSKKTRPGR